MSTMTFRMVNGELKLINDKTIERIEQIKTEVKEFKNSKKSILFSIAPTGIILGNAVGAATGTGIFWNLFMQYIFPYLIDIAKVYCVIKIAQGFYEEKRGGRDSGSGFNTFVTYGKWLLLFHLIPFGVTLIDQLGEKMVTDLKVHPIR